MPAICKTVTVAGGGLSGSEAAWQLACRGVKVRLYEMRPNKMTPAHETGMLGELVCSNSLGGEKTTTTAGILKAELTRMGSLIMECAERSRVPAGNALAVGPRTLRGDDRRKNFKPPEHRAGARGADGAAGRAGYNSDRPADERADGGEARLSDRRGISILLRRSSADSRRFDRRHDEGFQGQPLRRRGRLYQLPDERRGI